MKKDTHPANSSSADGKKVNTVESKESKEPKKSSEPSEKEPIEPIPTEDQQEGVEQEASEQELWKDRYRVLAAEFDNTQKRMMRERLAWIDMTKKDLIVQFLPILDDIERALDTFKDESNPQKEVKKGIEIIYKNLDQLLQKNGIAPIEVQVGDDLDPTFHKALTKMSTQEAKLKGKIVQIIAKGYTLNEKVIRHTHVIVGA